MSAASAQQKKNNPAIPAFVKKRFVPIPKNFYEVLPRKASSDTQIVLIGFIIYRTLGEPQKPKTVQLLTTWLAQQIGCSLRTVEMCIKDALDRGLIARKKASDKRCFEYEALYELWGALPDYTPQVATNAYVDQPSTRESLRTPAAGAQVLKLRPGQPEKIAYTDGIQVSFENTTRKEVHLSVAIDEEGALIARTTPEQTPKNDPKRPPTEEPISPQNLRVFSGQPQSLQHENFGSGEAEQAKIDELHDQIGPTFEQWCSKPLDPDFAFKIVKALGPVTVEAYAELVQNELSKPKWRKERPGSGMFLTWAGQASDKHVKSPAREDAQHRAAAVRQQTIADHQRESYIEQLRYLVTRPASSLDSTEREILVTADPADLAEAKRLTKTKDRPH